jgi:hypothetical protein
LQVKLPLRQLAGRIAEAQIDLCRVRHVRNQVFSQFLHDHFFRLCAHAHGKAAILPSVPRTAAADMPFVELRKLFNEMSDGPHAFTMILSQQIEKLLAIDRYERRALSRRKFAIRAFYEAQHNQH